MSISGKMYAWGERARNVPDKPGVYAFFNGAQKMIYLGESSNLREDFCQHLETGFQNDVCKHETKFYKRELTTNPKQRIEELLDEYRKRHGGLPRCNFEQKCSSPSSREVGSEWGFYFYEGIGKPLYEVALNPQELSEKIKEVSIVSLEFHQKRGDLARWIREVFQEKELAGSIERINQTGNALRRALLQALTGASEGTQTCPRCGYDTEPVKTWKMAGRPSRTGERLQLTIGYYKCPTCQKSFRKVLAKEKILID